MVQWGGVCTQTMFKSTRLQNSLPPKIDFVLSEVIMSYVWATASLCKLADYTMSIQGRARQCQRANKDRGFRCEWCSCMLSEWRASEVKGVEIKAHTHNTQRIHTRKRTHVAACLIFHAGKSSSFTKLNRRFLLVTHKSTMPSWKRRQKRKPNFIYAKNPLLCLLS